MINNNAFEHIKNEDTIDNNVEKENKGKIIAIILFILGFLFIGLFLFFYFHKAYFTVRFIDNGKEVKKEEIEKGKKIKELAVNNEYFIGWYDNDQLFDFDTIIEKDYVLNTRYREVKKYTVTFDTDGGSIIETIMVDENKTVSEPSIPTKDNYDFVEWQLDGKTYDFNTIIEEDIILKAVWKEKDNKVIIRFDSTGGSSIKNQTIKINETVKKPLNPTRKGYIFKEWQLDGKTYDFNTKVEKAITLVAVWEEKKKVTLSFNTDGGNSIDSKLVYVNEEVGELKNPIKEGFIFIRWDLNGTTFNSSSKISKDTTIKAIWETKDEINLTNAKKAIKSKYDITKSNQEISVTSEGCSIIHDSIGRITRQTSDSNITINFHITCGSKKANQTSTGVVKASTYKYTVSPSGNMINSYVKVSGVTTGSLYKSGNNVGDIKDGQAIVNDIDLENNPILQLKIYGDDTIYEVRKG